jgi:hypothetical protein
VSQFIPTAEAGGFLGGQQERSFGKIFLLGRFPHEAADSPPPAPATEVTVCTYETRLRGLSHA